MTSNGIPDGVKDKYDWKLAGLRTFLERLYDSSVTKLIAQLCKGKRISSKKIKELRTYLDSL